MTEAKAQTQRARHWLPDEDQLEAQGAAEQGTAEASWTLAADTGESDMDKAEMLELQQVWDRLELLKPDGH